MNKILFHDYLCRFEFNGMVIAMHVSFIILNKFYRSYKTSNTYIQITSSLVPNMSSIVTCLTKCLDFHFGLFSF